MTGQQAAARDRGGAPEGISVLAEGVVRRFGDRVVLDHLRLEIAASEFVVLLGPSGCGKTTLLRLLGGLDLPDAGTVSVPRARAIVFQGARLLPWQRVWQNVTIGLYGYDAKSTALSVLDEVGLSGRAGAWPKTLSGGEAQRVALARALVSDPALVLLDEPFAALDAITRLRMHDLVRALRYRHNATMLLVTHDVDEAIALADRILIMRDGRIGSEHRVTLGRQDRSRGLAREELRADLLVEIGVSSGG
jgi:sulfonate transport system ATP-binding protein